MNKNFKKNLNNDDNSNSDLQKEIDDMIAEDVSPSSTVIPESKEQNVENFLNMFSEEKQEEVLLSENSIRNIETDIVLEKTKKKFPFGAIALGILFVVFLALALVTSYIFATYSVIFDYNVNGANYYNNNIITFSLVEKDEYCDPSSIEEGTSILYTEDDLGKTFLSCKALKVERIGKSTVYGYDFESCEYKEISFEKVCYISNEEFVIPGQNE